MAFTYSSDDVARTKVVDAKIWLPFEVTKYQEKPSKDGTSINHVVDFKAIGDEDHKGMLLTAYFSEKAPGMAFGFLNAMGVEIDKAGGTVDFNAFVGRQVLICVEPRDFEGRQVNNIVEYRPID